MGKKDATGTRSAPVEQYRKQIGKQDYKKSRKEMKSMKSKADAQKSASPVKDTLLIVTTGLFMVVGLYVFLFWYLNKDEL